MGKATQLTPNFPLCMTARVRMMLGSKTNSPPAGEQCNEGRKRPRRRSSGTLALLCAFFVILMIDFATPARAAGRFCTRTDGGNSLCAPIEFFSTAHWGLTASASWNAYYQYKPDPWPDFPSAEALIQAFVSANPAAARCHTAPYVYRGFAYEPRLAGYYYNVYPATSAMSYADGVSPDIGPDRQAEEASVWYQWVVPSEGGPCT